MNSSTCIDMLDKQNSINSTQGGRGRCEQVRSRQRSVNVMLFDVLVAVEGPYDGRRNNMVMYFMACDMICVWGAYVDR